MQGKLGTATSHSQPAALLNSYLETATQRPEIYQSNRPLYLCRSCSTTFDRLIKLAVKLMQRKTSLMVAHLFSGRTPSQQFIYSTWARAQVQRQLYVKVCYSHTSVFVSWCPQVTLDHVFDRSPQSRPKPILPKEHKQASDRTRRCKQHPNQKGLGSY